MSASCPGSSRFKKVMPEMIRCPHCHTEVEIWSDEFRARCQNCHAWVIREMGASCLDWCAKAEECVGSATLAAYRRGRKEAP